MTQIFQPMLLGPLMTRGSGKRARNLMMRINQADLIFMKELIEAGKVKPVIDRQYPLEKLGEAIRYYGQGHSRGKVVITISADQDLSVAEHIEKTVTNQAEAVRTER